MKYSKINGRKSKNSPLWHIVTLTCLVAVSPNLANADNLNFAINPSTENTILSASWTATYGSEYRIKWRMVGGEYWSEVTLSHLEAAPSDGKDVNWDWDVHSLLCNNSYEVNLTMKGSDSGGEQNKIATTASCSTEPSTAKSGPCPKGGFPASSGGSDAKKGCDVGFSPLGTTALVWHGWYAFLATDDPFPCRTFEHNKSAEHSYILSEGNCLVARVPDGVVPFVADRRYFYEVNP